ncbi:MAG: glycosyltransferase [Pseudomonadota bacterium]
MKADFTIIITAYNEEQAIGKGLQELRSDYGDQADIIVVNDGSDDKTKRCVLTD